MDGRIKVFIASNFCDGASMESPIIFSLKFMSLRALSADWATW